MNDEHIFRDAFAAANQLETELERLKDKIDDGNGDLGVAITRVSQVKTRLNKLLSEQPVIHHPDAVEKPPKTVKGSGSK